MTVKQSQENSSNQWKRDDSNGIGGHGILKREKGLAELLSRQSCRAPSNSPSYLPLLPSNLVGSYARRIWALLYWAEVQLSGSSYFLGMMGYHVHIVTINLLSIFPALRRSLIPLATSNFYLSERSIRIFRYSFSQQFLFFFFCLNNFHQ